MAVIDQYFKYLVEAGGSDLHLSEGQPPKVRVNGTISAVISSSPEAYALKRAERAGVPGHVLRREDYPDVDAMTRALVALLRSLKIDLVVMAGYMTIVSNALFQAYENAVINIHPSLIPSFCGRGCYGLHVHEKALEYGVKVSGATVHFVNEECDAGPIILQQAAEVLPDDTPESLQRRIMEQCEWKLLPRAVSLFCQDRLKVEGRTVRILNAE